MLQRRAPLLLALIAAGCGGAPTPSSVVPSPLPFGNAPPLADVIHVYDTRTGARVSLEHVIADAHTADAIFLGESHTDETTHRVELAIYEGLIARRPRDVVLALEMFTRADQPALDRYLAGELDEAGFLAQTNTWTNYRTGYRALIERARRDRLPVLGSNAPRSVIRSIMMGGGKAGFEALGADERALVAPELLPNSDAYWQRYDRVTRGHGHGHGGADDPAALAESRLYSTQSVWDNTMGFTCAERLDRQPDALVVHVNGSFHSNRRQGTVEQLLARKPDARVVTVTIIETDDLTASVNDLDRELADYVVFAERRARGVDSGWHAVMVDRELRYRLLVPETASPEAPAPLLIWLGEEGTPPADIAAYWQLALGAEAAIAVVEPPYREHQEQLFVGGRWYWSDTFPADVSATIAGIDRVAAYVGRHFPVDRERVVIAGAGAGATVIAAAALYATQGRPALAFAPRRADKLAEMALPMQTPPGALQVYAEPAARAWWDREIAQYRDIGFDAAVTDDAGSLGRSIALRAALGLPPAAPAEGERTVLAVANDSPLALHRAELYRLALARTGVDASVVTARELASASEPPAGKLEPLMLAGERADGVPDAPRLGADRFADGKGLPLAPGDFGGTTVVVLPAGLDDAQRAAWRALDQSDALAERSRFSHLRIAELEGDAALPTVLQEIRAAHRSNVLIVPAVFCASAEDMRALRAAAGPLDGLTVTWLPGLGGRLRHTLPEPDDEADADAVAND